MHAASHNFGEGQENFLNPKNKSFGQLLNMLLSISKKDSCWNGVCLFLFFLGGGGQSTSVPTRGYVPGSIRQFKVRFDDFFRRQMRQLLRRGRCERWSPAAEANDTERQTQTGSVYNWWVTASQPTPDRLCCHAKTRRKCIFSVWQRNICLSRIILFPFCSRLKDYIAFISSHGRRYSLRVKNKTLRFCRNFNNYWLITNYIFYSHIQRKCAIKRLLNISLWQSHLKRFVILAR